MSGEHHPRAADVLAQGVRVVDGDHTLGAAALADALLPYLTAAGLAIVDAETGAPLMERLAPTFPEDAGPFGWFCREDDSVFWANDNDGYGAIAERLYVKRAES